MLRTKPSYFSFKLQPTEGSSPLNTARELLRVTFAFFTISVSFNQTNVLRSG